MHLDLHIAGQRLARLRERARSSAVRESKRARKSTLASAPAPDPRDEAVAADNDAMVLDRRRSARIALSGSELRVRRIGGFNFQAGLKDVSTDGCRIELIEECEPGEDVIARFPQLEPLGAWVRWTLGATAGVEFMRPIHPAVFKFLLTRLSEQGSAA
jgi:hypothetical protein